MILHLETPIPESPLQQRICRARAGLRLALISTNQPALSSRVSDIGERVSASSEAARIPYQKKGFWPRLGIY